MPRAWFGRLAARGCVAFGLATLLGLAASVPAASGLAWYGLGSLAHAASGDDEARSASGAVAETPAQGGPDYRRALAISQAAIGARVGAFTLRDSAGQPVAMSDLRGKPLVLHFIYTGCFQACPVATQFLAKAVRQAREALGEDSFRVASIGFNQPFDSPAAMASFASQNRITERDWLFLSPNPNQVDALTANLGFVYEATPKGFDHIAQVTVIDADGVVYRQVYGESFDLPMLVGPLKELLSGQASARFTLTDVWTKVKLYCTVYDPYSGGYRVNYALFFELFAGLTVLGAVAWFLVRERRRAGRAERGRLAIRERLRTGI